MFVADKSIGVAIVRSVTIGVPSPSVLPGAAVRVYHKEPLEPVVEAKSPKPAGVDKLDPSWWYHSLVDRNACVGKSPIPR